MTKLALMTLEERDAVAVVTLNRPKARNPTSIAMLDAIDTALDAAEANDRVRVLHLRGEGRSFCAGLDLSEVTGGEETIRRLLTRLSEVMRRIRRLPFVTISLVQGAAIGGGFGFMAVTDFAITHPESKIGYPPLSTGLSPALMAPWLVRKIGPSRARAMLMAGGTISGRAAYHAGIASHLVGEEEIEATARSIGASMMEGVRYGAVAMKSFLNELDDSISDEMLDRAATVSADVIACDETQARLRSLFPDR